MNNQMDLWSMFCSFRLHPFLLYYCRPPYFRCSGMLLPEADDLGKGFVLSGLHQSSSSGVAWESVRPR